jgi:lysozyme
MVNYSRFRPDPDYLDEDELSGGYGWFGTDDGNEVYGADRALASQITARRPPQPLADQSMEAHRLLTAAAPDQRLAQMGSPELVEAENAERAASAIPTRRDVNPNLDATYDQILKAQAQTQGGQGQQDEELLTPAPRATESEGKAPPATASTAPAGAASAPETPPDPLEGGMSGPASQLSEAGRERLKLIESGKNGPQLEPYQDAGGVWTVGYGDTHGVEPGKPITAEEAEQRFDDRTGEFTRGVLGMVKVPLSQNQLDALVSVGYNTGLGGLEKSDIVKRLNEGDYEGAGKAIAGLERRRQEERALFEGRDSGQRASPSGAAIDQALARDPSYAGGNQLERLAMDPGMARNPGNPGDNMDRLQGRAPQAPGLRPIGGMAPAQMQVQGIPKTPEEIAAQQQQTAQAYDKVIADAERARDDRVKARTDAATRQAAEASVAQTRAFNSEMRARVAQDQATQKIDAEVAKPIEKVNPRRLISGMSTGQMLLGAVAAALGGIGRGPNYALQVMQNAIDADIDAQKEDIRSGRARSENRIAHWTRQLGDAQQGELAARAEYYQATSNLLKAQDMSVETADIQAQHQQVLGQLELNKTAALQQLKDAEANRYVTQYQPPVSATIGPVPVGEKDPAKTDPVLNAQLVRQFSARPAKEQEAMLQRYGESKGRVDEFGRLVDEIAVLYGAKWDENAPNQLARDPKTGEPIDPATGKPVDFVSSATGVDPFDAMDERLPDASVRRLTQLYDKLRLHAREGWKTEPNGQVWQERLSSVDIPTRDSDVPAYLERLKSLSLQMRKDVDTYTLPEVRAYQSAQARQTPRVTPVQGRYAGR